ncbi:hypothetical protein [Gymnodinialimonas sp.]
MTAIVPLNVVALRVSNVDHSNVTLKFKGLTAAFDKLPYEFTPNDTRASTGDAINRPLATNRAVSALEAGIHLHWELPDAFKRGAQRPDGSIHFPHAPNRWLVVRSISVKGAATPVQSKAWVVESDYVSVEPAEGPDKSLRRQISVPLKAGANDPPFMYMGRVLEAEGWDPSKDEPANYLTHFKNPQGGNYFLNSIGFVGPAFASYYPDCRTVFGFWDNFYDLPELSKAINGNLPAEFTASYQVFGALSDAATDPLASFADAVRTQYDDYVDQTIAEKTPIKRTPTDVFLDMAQRQFGWIFKPDAVSYTLNDSDGKLDTLTAPEATLVAGLTQEIAWNQEKPLQDTPFLASPTGEAFWTDAVKVAVGNTTAESMSALISSDLPPAGGTGVLESYEFLLDALQLGILRDIEATKGSQLSVLAETVHSKSFGSRSGGQLWAVSQLPDPAQPAGAPPQAGSEVTLPLPLAEQLHILNVAQQTYDRAQARLDELRRQLFMDWVTYVKQFTRLNVDPQSPTPYVTIQDLQQFIGSRSSGELGFVMQAHAEAGVISYVRDPQSGAITGVSTSSDATTAAGALVAAYNSVDAALKAHKHHWQLEASNAQPFWHPTDPVLAIEGDRIEPVRRNGATHDIDVRTTAEVIGKLSLTSNGKSFEVAAGDLAGLATVPSAWPHAATAAALVAEAGVLMPLFAPCVQAALAAQGGADNPAMESPTAFVEALRLTQGGQSPQVGAPASGLFQAVHAEGADPKPNPVEAVTTPLDLSVTFANDATAWAPDPVGWTKQTAMPAFSKSRVDPFLPVWLLWEAELSPLERGLGPNPGKDYLPDAIERRFELDDDAVDYVYPVENGAPLPGLTNPDNTLTYSGAALLNRRPMKGLSEQIGAYLKDFPNDGDADKDLKRAREGLLKRRILSQSLSGLSQAQTLRAPIPQIEVENLIFPFVDTTTPKVADAAKPAPPVPSWYDVGFNDLSPISTGPLAQYNFGPLRSGFMDVSTLTIVDVFGQIMELDAGKTASGAMETTRAFSLMPPEADTKNAERIFLPPRSLAPARLDFDWLSARFDGKIKAVDGDFIMMNDHPATSPICGWVVPNHLDVSLMFYDGDSSPIGSFGVENDKIRYRTRPGNTANPGSVLDVDIGPLGDPANGTNPHLAEFMHYVNGQSATGLYDLMHAIEASDQFINPALRNDSVSLSVLIGRPLALVRAKLGLSTLGGILPVSQAYTSEASALSKAVLKGWTDYETREANTSANLSAVTFPVRMGNLASIDDGLVAFLPEAKAKQPYTIVYSAFAKATGTHGVVRPQANTVQLTLNDLATPLTMLIDPRAPVHATTGILPVTERAVPPDQFAAAMADLAVTFATHPVLRTAQGLSLPLPEEAGFDWSWVMYNQPTEPLSPGGGTDVATYGYTPQTLQDGWLKLSRTPEKSGSKS